MKLHSPLHSSKNLDSISSAPNKALPGKSWINCKITGVGACAGKNLLPNSDYETLVETSDAWIAKRTGIRNRHLIAPGSNLRDLAITSAKAALESAGVAATDIDLLLVATSSPDDLFGDAPSVAFAIGAVNAAAFDVTAACSGFVIGLVTASQFVQSGAYKKVLVIGADALTRFVDWKDRGTCILFGDGAGAVVLERSESALDSGLLGFALHSDGEGYKNLNMKFNQDFKELDNLQKTIVDQGSYGKMQMNGAEVYKFAVNKVR